MSRNHVGIGWREWALLRRAVLNRDGYRCQSCGVASRLEVDHIVPLAHGGDAFDLANLQALCRGCHIAKTRAQTTLPERLSFRRYVDALAQSGAQ